MFKYGKEVDHLQSAVGHTQSTLVGHLKLVTQKRPHIIALVAVQLTTIKTTLRTKEKPYS